jgi:hypothetical protein
MVRNARPVFRGRFCGADIEMPVHLAGIRAHNLAVELLRGEESQLLLPGSGRAADDQDFWEHKEP